MRSLPTILVLLFGCLALSYPLADTDIWWHLAAGREMARGGSPLRTDPFCSSSLGTAWIDLHAGFQLAVWHVWTIFGDDGLVALRIALPLAALGLAFRRRWSGPAALAACLCLWTARPFVDARPILLTLVLLAVVQHLLEADPGLRRPGTWIAGAVAQCGLANTQGLFLLGPLLAAAFALGASGRVGGDILRRKIGYAALLLAASLANPWGIQAFGLAGTLAGRILPWGANLFSAEIPENAPLWRWLGEDPARVVPLVWLGIALRIGWRGGEGARARVLLLVAAGALSLAAVRNLPLLVLEIAFCLDFRSGLSHLRAWTWSSASLVAAFLVLSVFQRRWDLPDSRVAPLRLPGDEAVALVRNAPGSLFHEIRAGGWLTWKADRTGVCWSDTRLVLHDREFVGRYLDWADRPARFPDAADRNGFRQVLLPLVEFPRFHPLVVHLLRSKDWQVRHADGAWILFERKASRDGSASSLPLASIDTALHRRFGANPRLEERVRRQWREILERSGAASPSLREAP